MNMPCSNTAALSDYLYQQDQAEIHYELFGKAKRQADREHVIHLAQLLLAKQPTSIRRSNSVFSYTRDDVLEDLLNHDLIDAARAAYRKGNRSVLKDLVIRVTQRGVARSMWDTDKASELGFYR